MLEARHRRRQAEPIGSASYGEPWHETYFDHRDHHHEQQQPYERHHHHGRHRRRRDHRDDSDYDSDGEFQPRTTSPRRSSRRPAIYYDSRVLNPHVGSSLYTYVPARRSNSLLANEREISCSCAGCRGHQRPEHGERGRSQERGRDRRESGRSRHRDRDRDQSRDAEGYSDNEARKRRDKSRRRGRSRDREPEGHAASGATSGSRPWTPDQGMALVALPRAAAGIGRRYARSPSSPVARNRLSYPPSSTAPYPRYGLSTSALRPSAAIQSSTPSPPRLSFNVAASFIGKGIPYEPARHTVELTRNSKPFFPSTSSVSRADRVDSGHDSFFISRVGDNGTMAFGVTDGVGGWVNVGVDPGDFSHALCANMAEASAASDPKDLTARGIMHEGYVRSCRDPNLRAGGSTACVAVASPTSGVLEVANLGDSGFAVLRSRALLTFSPPQTHAFNTPYQLAIVPPHIIERAATYGGGHHIDMPSDADIRHVALRRGDVVVFATDGVWDNLFNEDILRTTNRVMKHRGAWEQADGDEDGVHVTDNLEALVSPSLSSSPDGSGNLQSELAVELVTMAKAVSKSKRLVTPFGKSIKRRYPNEAWLGGKVDDICVVVMVVSDGTRDVRSRL